MDKRKIKSVIVYILTISSILILLLSLVLMIVDPVAIIFTYISLLFIFPSVYFKNKIIIKAYIVLFLISNAIFLFYIYQDSIRNNNIDLNHSYSKNPFLH